MGEIADLMVNGDICETCGQWLSDLGDGYPRTCTDCGGDAELMDEYDGDSEWEGEEPHA